jgi:hypothetical protein
VGSLLSSMWAVLISSMWVVYYRVCGQFVIEYHLWASFSPPWRSTGTEPVVCVGGSKSFFVQDGGESGEQGGELLLPHH